jgi:hypothetical protein
LHAADQTHARALAIGGHVFATTYMAIALAEVA